MNKVLLSTLFASVFFCTSFLYTQEKGDLRVNSSNAPKVQIFDDNIELIPIPIPRSKREKRYEAIETYFRMNKGTLAAKDNSEKGRLVDRLKSVPGGSLIEKDLVTFVNKDLEKMAKSLGVDPCNIHVSYGLDAVIDMDPKNVKIAHTFMDYVYNPRINANLWGQGNRNFKDDESEHGGVIREDEHIPFVGINSYQQGGLEFIDRDGKWSLIHDFDNESYIFNPDFFESS